MKKITLLFIFIFSIILSPTILAKSSPLVDNFAYKYYSNYEKQFTFVESGITFSVFQNGEFDFYINPRNNIHTNINFGLVNISFNSGCNYDAYVQYDTYGALIQIEGVPVYYDYYGRVKQIGNISLNYFGNRLTRIGNLNVHYNRYGQYSYYTGYINYVNRAYVFHPFHNFFIRPILDRCVVSYNPYRRYYNPSRFDYQYGSNNHYNYYKKNKSFKRIESKIRTADSNRSRNNKNYSNSNNRVSKNTTYTRSQNSKRNHSNSRSNTRSNNSIKNQNTTYNVKTIRNRVSSGRIQVAQNTKKDEFKTPHRRNAVYRPTSFESINKNRSVQRKSTRSYNPQKKITYSKNVSNRSSTRSKNYNLSRSKSFIKKNNQAPISKSRKNKRSNTNRKNS